MGTNYYWRHNICSCCGRYDSMHICKSLVSFQGYFDEAEWDDERREFKPAPPLIVSWQQWKAKLRAGEGEVWDEYGDRLDTEQFIADVEATDADNRRRQYDWVVRNDGLGYHREFGVVPRGEWLDPDGFSFYGGEFS